MVPRRGMFLSPPTAVPFPEPDQPERVCGSDSTGGGIATVEEGGGRGGLGTGEGER